MTNRRTVPASYRSRKLDASRASLMFGTALGVSIAIFAASPQQAWAADECGADVASVATCTGAGNPYPTGIDYTADAGEDITVVLTGTVDVITGTDDGVTATNNNGDATGATIEIDAGATITSALDGADAIVTGGTGNAYIYNDGVIAAADRGLFAYSFGGDAYATNTGAINMDGTASAAPFTAAIVTNGGFSSIDNSGDLTVVGGAGDVIAVGAYAYSFFGSSVGNSGAVDITNTGGAAIGLEAYSVLGYADVNNSGDITIDSSGAATGIAAISALQFDAATITNTADLDVTSTGGAARGDVAYGYTADVEQTGNVTVNGATSAYAIEVDTYLGNDLGTAIVNVTGDLNATAGTGFAEGVDIYAGGDVTVTVDGAITATSGAGAYGVFAVSYYGDVNVTVDSVDLTAVTAGAGVDVFAGGFDGAADATVSAGDITVTGAGVEGIEVDAINGNATVTAGDISTAGVGAEGVDSYAFLDSTVTTGDITTTGTGSDGVHNYSFAGDTSTTVGDVTTTADDSYGVYAYAFLGGSDVNAGDINTSGVGSTGIFAYGYTYASVTADSVTTTGNNAEGVEALSVGSVVIDTNLVVTSGNSSTGIDAISGDSYVLVNSGTVNTTGDDSDGIFAASLGTDATDYVTVNSDAITTDGLNSDGIVAYAYAGDVTVDSGTIDTLGGNSYGIYAYAYLGDVDVTSDAVTTAGINSDGVWGKAYFGYATIDSGSVDTDGDNSIGIYAYGYTGVNVTSDSVQTDGNNSGGIRALSAGGPVTVDSGTVATLGDGSIGIFAYGYGGTTVTSDTVTTDGLGSEGIVALDLLGPVSVTSGSVDTLGDYSTGIRAGSFYDVTVDSGTVETSGQSSVGIYAYSVGGAVLGDGSVDVTFDSVVTHGDAYYQGSVYLPAYQVTLYYYATSSNGIVATAGTGEVSVVGGDVTTYGTGAEGIIASGFGDVFVDVDDVVTHGDALLNYAYTAGATDYYRGAIGIDATVTGGDVTVYADTVTTYGDEATGIVAVGNAYYDSVSTTFSGDTLVGVNSVVTHGDNADGIVASNSGGNVDVFVNSVETYGDGSDGIVAAAVGYYDSANVQTIYGDAYVSAGSVTTHGDDAFGIYAISRAGDAIVNAYTVHTYGDGATGIYAAAFNYYDSSAGAEQNLHGDVDVTVGSVTTEGDFANGVEAYAEGGNIDIDAGTVVTFGDFSDGIVAYAAYYGPDPVLLTYYSGDVTVTADNVTTFGDFSDGINAYAGGGDVNIYAGNVLTYGLGSDAIYAGTGGLDVNNTDNVYVNTTGDVFSYYGTGIRVNSAGYSTIQVDSTSNVYGYVWGIDSASVDGTYIYNDGTISGYLGAAINVDGGAASIYNDGFIYGYVNLTDNNDYLYNSGTWEAYGTSQFGLGADEVANEGVVGFSRYQGAASTTTFAGLENFNNFGVVTGVDGQAGDVLNISGNFFGGNNPLTPGTETSELDLDVQLGGPGSIADRLVIGSASGATEIVPNDVLGASPGALNFGGILVVDSANPAEVGTEFTMANVDKGFIEYSLIFDAANDNWLIVGLPDQEVFELLGAMSSSQDFWKRSGDAVTARWQEIRDASSTGGASAGPGGMGRSDGWELWMQAHGGDESFDNAESFAFNGFTFATDLTADSDWRGFQFGFDNLQGNMLWGLTMGFNQQETKFDFDANSFDTEGWNVGGYFGWASNGFFLNGLVKGDFFSQDANFHTMPSIFSFDGVTWGAQGELGYRWEGDSWFFEPIAAISWNTTSLDSVTTAGATIDFDDSTSFRGKAGARIGGTWGSGDVVWTPYIGAYYVDEWEGDNALTFTTGPTSITFNDQGRGAYGLADFGVTFQTFYGLEGFVKGEWNFGGDADGGAARLGARWRW